MLDLTKFGFSDLLNSSVMSNLTLKYFNRIGFRLFGSTEHKRSGKKVVLAVAHPGSPDARSSVVVKFGDLIRVERPERLQLLAQRRQRAERRRFSAAEPGSRRLSLIKICDTQEGLGAIN